MVSVAAGLFKELPFFPGGPLQSESALHDDGEKYETSDMPFIRFDRVSFRDCVDKCGRNASDRGHECGTINDLNHAVRLRVSFLSQH